MICSTIFPQTVIISRHVTPLNKNKILSQVSDFYMVKSRKPSISGDGDALVNCTRHRSDRRDHLYGDSNSDGAIVLLLRLLLAAEVRSSHPLSKGLVEFSRKRLEEHDSATGGAKSSSSYGNGADGVHAFFISQVCILVQLIPFQALNHAIIPQ